MTSDAEIPKNWLKSARDKIWSAMYRNGFSDDASQSFITRDRLEAVWLSQRQNPCLLDEFERYVPTISRAEVKDHLLSILSILILIHWDNWSSFKDYFGIERGKLKDGDLPLSPAQCREVFRSSPSDVHPFRQQQYAFIPVHVEQKPSPPFLESEWRLPLTFEGEKNEEGSFGTVYKVKIARGYLRSKEGKLNDAEVTAARKVFEGQPNYTKELKNLSVLRSGEFQHNRVMEHLGSVVIGGRFSIFYPWADFNLEEFFAGIKRPAAIRNEDITPKSLLKESFWLAHALEFLHTQLHDAEGNSVQCCHMDLKPDNILVIFGDPDYALGKWKIADFGISNIEPRSMSPSIRDFYNRTTATRPETRPPSVRTPRYPGPFQPPEAENPTNWSHQSTKDLNDLKGDVWSFGCILLVVLVFAIGGKAYVDVLVDRRQVGLDCDDVNRSGRFYRKQPELRVMLSVSDWLNALAKQQSVWFQQAWAFISGHMLMIDPTKRSDANIVTAQVQGWIMKAEANNKWAEAPDPNVVTRLTNLAQVQTDVENHQDNILRSSVETSPEHPLTRPVSRNTAQNLRNAAQTPLMPDLTEEPESILDPDTTEIHSENHKTRASTFNHSRQASEDLSQRSSMSIRSENQVPMVDLSHHLKKETAVVADLDGHRIAFLNSRRVKLFSRRPDEAAAAFSIEDSVDFKSRHRSSWEQIQLAGRFIFLRDEQSLSISSRDLLNELEDQSWDNKVISHLVLGFDVSWRGSIAFRLRHEVKVFMSISPEPSVEWAAKGEHVKAVSFSCSGDRLIAVCDRTWTLWNLQNDFNFQASLTGDHQFSRPEHGTFEPYIIPFNTSPQFLLWDKRYRDRIAMIRHGSSAIWIVPAETRNVAISHDDQRLVLLTVKTPPIRLGHCKYTLQWTSIVPDRDGKLAIEGEYEKHSFSIKGGAEPFRASLVIVDNSESGVALIAFSNGYIEQVRLT